MKCCTMGTEVRTVKSIGVSHVKINYYTACGFLSAIQFCVTWRAYHHHCGQAPGWSVAVSTSCLHRPLSWASHHAEFSPWLSGWRSASRSVRSQMWRGRPGWRFQSLDSPQIDIFRALDVSCESPIRATCPQIKNWSHLVWMSGSSCGGEPAWSHTSTCGR